MENKNIQIIFGVIALALVAFFVYQFSGTQKDTQAPVPTPVQVNATTTTGDPTLDELVQSGRATVAISTTTNTNATPQKNAPSLSYVLKIPPTLAANAVTALNTQISTLTAEIKKNPTSFDSWMRMGVLAKIAGDFSRAIEVWKYAAYLASGSPAPYANMADVYANYLKDYANGAANYKKAIEKDPTNPNYYSELFNLYNYSYRTTPTAAEDTIHAGIKAVPSAYELHVLLARYYKSIGKSAQATAEFKLAIQVAEKQNNVDAVAQIKAEAGE